MDVKERTTADKLNCIYLSDKRVVAKEAVSYVEDDVKATHDSPSRILTVKGNEFVILVIVTLNLLDFDSLIETVTNPERLDTYGSGFKHLKPLIEDRKSYVKNGKSKPKSKVGRDILFIDAA